MSVPYAAPSNDAYWQANRRKVRKGTHSCWECKRRKMKCRFDPRIASAACNGCRRRGSPCISQEFSEGLADALMGIGSSDGPFFDGTDSERADPIPMSGLTTLALLRHHKSPEVRLFQLFPQGW